MSQENVRLVKEASEVMARDGLDAALAYFHPNVEWIVPEWLEGEAFLGHEGVRRAFAVMEDVFEHYRLDVEEVIDCHGDRVVALLYQRGLIKGTDNEIEQQIAYDVEIHDGLATRVLVCGSMAQSPKESGDAVSAVSAGFACA